MTKRKTDKQLEEWIATEAGKYPYQVDRLDARGDYWRAEAYRARRREEALEELSRRLLKARGAGMSLADMQAMIREAGIEL